MLRHKLLFHVREKLFEGGCSLFCCTIDEEQEAGATLCDHRLPGTHCLGAQEFVVICANEWRGMLFEQDAQAEIGYVVSICALGRKINGLPVRVFAFSAQYDKVKL